MTDPIAQNRSSEIDWDSKSANPIAIFETWFEDAKAIELNDPNAMFVATVDQSGMPNVRTVLMKSFDQHGCVFYTNLTSAKGVELQFSLKAAVCFHWKSLGRQVRLRGDVEPVSTREADDYFSSRVRTSQLGAWASKQSRPLKSRGALLKEVAKFAMKFGIMKVPRPAHWSGFRLVPCSIEFWQEGQHRLHTRHLFLLDSRQKRWRRTALQP